MDGQRSGTDGGEATVTLQAKLAEVLWRTGRLAEAREAYHDALAAAPTDRLRGARIQTSLGRLEDYDNRTEPTLAAFDTARTATR